MFDKASGPTESRLKRGRGSSVYVPSLGHIREAIARPLQRHAVNPTDPSGVSRYPWVG